jgi:hypothetical protein
MPKKIAVLSYNLNPASSEDAVAMRDILNSTGYSAELVNQWALNETNPKFFKMSRDWERYDGIVISDFYRFWTTRELILSGRPVVCANVGYVDNLGLGECVVDHTSEDDFSVVNTTHPIMAGTGLAAGSVDIGNPVWTDSISTHNHLVDILVTTLSNNPVLVAHKTYPLVYFGWYRMSQASPASPLHTLLTKSANWAFQGP